MGVGWEEDKRCVTYGLEPFLGEGRSNAAEEPCCFFIISKLELRSFNLICNMQVIASSDIPLLQNLQSVGI